jgi:hypothetical protein
LHPRSLPGHSLLTVAATISLCLLLTGAALAQSSGFTRQKRVGFQAGDQWEPAIAADGYAHVYILYPQYVSLPQCPSCVLPRMVLVVSNDNGATWEQPRQISPSKSGQFDPQITVDPADRRTVYVAWLQNDKRDTVVSRSADFGRTWSVAVANHAPGDVDKPVLAVRGPNVYVGFNRRQRLWVASSHDGGETFTSVNVDSNPKLGWSVAGGATVDPTGNVYFSWAGYFGPSGPQGRVNLYVSRSDDGGQSWNSNLLDVSAAPPACSTYQCGWAYLGAQITLTSDTVGTLYALWNAGSLDGAPQRVYFSSSTSAGTSWSARLDVSSSGITVEHCFPAIVAGAAGDVRIAWMDTRRHGLWNTYYRASNNGGATWSAESQLSGFIPGYDFIKPEGFSFPFGDYFEIDIDSNGDTQAVWGEGLNFRSPGSIWYSHGR